MIPLKDMNYEQQPMPDAPLPVRSKTNPNVIGKGMSCNQWAAEYIAALVDRINTLEDANTRLRQEFDQVKDRLDEHFEALTSNDQSPPS